MRSTEPVSPARSAWVRWSFGVTAALVGTVGVVIGLVSLALVGFAGVGLIAGDDCPPEEMCEGLGAAVAQGALVVGLIGLFLTWLLAMVARAAWLAARGRRLVPSPPRQRVDPGTGVSR